MIAQELKIRSTICYSEDCALGCAGVKVADDATVEFRSDERVEFSYLFTKMHVGRSQPRRTSAPEHLSSLTKRSCVTSHDIVCWIFLGDE